VFKGKSHQAQQVPKNTGLYKTTQYQGLKQRISVECPKNTGKYNKQAIIFYQTITVIV